MEAESTDGLPHGTFAMVPVSQYSRHTVNLDLGNSHSTVQLKAHTQLENQEGLRPQHLQGTVLDLKPLETAQLLKELHPLTCITPHVILHPGSTVGSSGSVCAT